MCIVTSVSIRSNFNPIGFSYAASQQFAVGRGNFRTFSICELGIRKCNFESPGTELVAMATLLLRGVCGSFKENYKKIAIST